MSTSGAKPFSLQSPELIAKQYEGNKQKIAQAVQLGLVDPTAGTLAGMFIDRMRAAATKEQGPPQTVAQQVLGSKPPVPPPGGPPMAPQAGGPPPSPMPAPQGAPPASSAAPMGGPPVRAADGGLMSIPIPDAMFDEPEGAAMARGGLVAFATGASTNSDLADDLERRRADAARAHASAASGDYGDVSDFLGQLGDKTVGFLGQLGDKAHGAMDAVGDAAGWAADKGIVDMPGLAEAYRAKKEDRDFRSASERGDVMKLSRPAPTASDKTPAPFRQPSHPHSTANMTPDGDIKAELAAATTPRTMATPAPAAGIGALAATAAKKAGPKHTSEIAAAAKQAAGEPPAPGQSADPIGDAIDRMKKYYEDPEYKAYMEGEKASLSKQKKEDVWTTLAQIGFGMAASKSPTLLGAIGEAGTAALPGMEKAMQARRAAESDYAKQRMAMRNQEVTAGIGAQQHEAELKQKKDIADMERELGIAKMHSEERQAAGHDAATRFAASQRQPSAADVMRENVDQMTQAYMLDPNNARRYYLDPSKFNDPAYMKRQDVQVAYRRLANAGRLDALQSFYKAQGLAHQQPFNPLVTPGGDGPSGGNRVAWDSL